MKLLKELCESAGVPGREDRLREIVRRELAPLTDQMRVDALGNLIAVKKASKGKKTKKLMIAAHMDEIGWRPQYCGRTARGFAHRRAGPFAVGAPRRARPA